MASRIRIHVEAELEVDGFDKPETIVPILEEELKTVRERIKQSVVEEVSLKRHKRRPGRERVSLVVTVVSIAVTTIGILVAVFH